MPRDWTARAVHRRRQRPLNRQGAGLRYVTTTPANGIRAAHVCAALYYTAIFEDRIFLYPSVDRSARPMALPWLLPRKEFRRWQGRSQSQRKHRVELAVDAWISQQVDNIMLFPGDGDFCSLLEAGAAAERPRHRLSSFRSKPPIIADELRRAPDTFHQLDDLKAAIVER